jgi:N-acyl-phosphatidylethanolamine-hydrolysing phospholipase D
VSGQFQNPWTHPHHSFWDALRWKFGLGPSDVVFHPHAHDPAAWEAISPQGWPCPPPGEWHVVWLGHASFLLRGYGQNILIDPVFSDHCAPFPFHFPAFKRKIPPPLTLQELPVIDLILLTHTHYDHCDLPTLRSFPRDTKIIVAEGHKTWLMRQGFTQVEELAWWNSILINDLHITATPAQHFTARSFFDRNRGHWCGWCIEGDGKKLWHAGDSGYCAVFQEIGERLGPMNLSMIPIGAYSPRWFMKAMHMNPEEAVKVFQETQSQQAIAMHWGTFTLTEEPIGEPPMLLAEALRLADISTERFVCLPAGACWIL